MVNIAVFASGSGTNFENIVKHMQAGTIKSATCKVLIVDKANAYAIERAKALNIPYVYVDPKAYGGKAGYETKIKEILDSYEVELIVLAGYMRYIGEVLLTNYPNKIINIHPAYLPNFPGAHGIKDAYDAKVEWTGVTVHYVDEGVDTGEIIQQEKLMIDPTWDLETLETHVHALEYDLFPRVIEAVCANWNK
ncbi:MAG: phosphoribosylglycinamide formyltransferase [Longicatena sp.]|jgi:phosphoribosylglycinamide formyltransferase-1|nr:phosphoribosylglycinamide formyltransferase [Longicatena sp.]